MDLSFLGAAGTVTGSRHLIEIDGKRILLDCGLFQGLKQLRLRNWAPFPVDPSHIDAIVLSHAHLDHSGYLPRLVREGFRGTIYATSPTIDLARLLLADSAHIQESDADFANRHRLSKHAPALPLYTMRDAEQVNRYFKAVPFGQPIDLAQGVSLTFQPAGHILGASIVVLAMQGKKLVFSGDLGRYNDPVMVDPARIGHADYLLLESTYGNREHPADDPAQTLAGIIERTVQRGGTVVIPSFAVGRAQLLLYLLQQLKRQGACPEIYPSTLTAPWLPRPAPSTRTMPMSSACPMPRCRKRAAWQRMSIQSRHPRHLIKPPCLKSLFQPVAWPRVGGCCIT